MTLSTRLEKPFGLLIDRSEAIEFQFEGQAINALKGDSIASALLANQNYLMSRSFKYHRARGPLTLAGQDANTLVQLEGEPNVLADRHVVTNGLRVTGQNCNGSLNNDSDAKLDSLGRFMPVGFYYRSFFKPAGIWNFWENVIRKKAGLGVVDTARELEYFDKAYLFYQVVVVGSGPAGLTAALKAAEHGAQVLLLEEQAILGGSLSYNRFDIEGLAADQLRAELLAKIETNKNIKVLLNATCNGWFSDNYLPVIQGSRMYKVRAQECIMATGSYEQHVVFRNNDLPGIVLTSAANRLMKHYAVKPGQSAVVLAGNDDAYLTAISLNEQGVNVVALIDMRSSADDADLTKALEMHHIPIKTNYTVYEAIPNQAKNRVKAVDIRRIVSAREVSDLAEIIECDLVCMSAGYMPAYQLLCQAGAQLSYDDEAAEFNISQLPEHLHIAGSVNGKHDLNVVIEDGKNAAIKALVNLKLVSKSETKQITELKCSAKPNFSWPIFMHPKGREFVDFDEDLQVKDIINATKLGYRDIQLVKRFSTVGMGPSQGRHSALQTARIVADVTDRSISETGVTTARPPFVAEKLGFIAGRIFDPYKRSTMHQRHLDLGAKMIPAGIWQRPAFYGEANKRDECIWQESKHVRTKVGVIDVSTLGGIEIRGPDAAEFMNRIYTFVFLKQAVGKTRYAILTNEQGVVIDDGVSCRISDKHFYVTATTSGVDRVYRDMLKWNIQWRLDIDISNVTTAFSAVNLAGPDARKVLQKLTTEIQLSAEDFPYLAYREGQVAGIPARLLRVGFVGELGYEIHVPALYGEALWDAVMDAGKEFNIKPFGVETQRLLRLEKGHIIISQDTDGMSHPGELSLDWAINLKKPFFVGSRSVEIVMARKQTRRLVGFALPKFSTKPEEGHLVLNGKDISGNVTSCEYSPSLGCIIGMAYVGIDQCAVNSQFPIRIDDDVVEATVVKLPFYDPDNERQEM